MDFAFLSSISNHSRRKELATAKRVVSTMSVAFTSGRRSEPTSQSIQALLDENTQLIQAIVDYQNKGKAYESTQYQQLLHRNLVYLATLADSNQTGQTSQSPNSQGGASVQKPSIHQQGPPAGLGPMGDGGSSGAPHGPILQSSGADMAPNPITAGGPPYSGMGSAPVSNFGQGTSSPPQLQHPPVSAPTHGPSMGYPTSSGNQVRSNVPPGMSGPMGGMQQHGSVPRHAQQMKQQPQHLMGGVQQAPQQYLMQQRQMQFRQPNTQQVPQQQPPMAPNPSTYGTQPGGTMMQGFTQQPSQQQPQQQRYNMYTRQPTPQQPLSHMPYAQQQSSQIMMGGQSAMTMGQMGMGGAGPMPGQSPMGPSSMVPNPMGPSGIGQSSMVPSPLGSSSMGQSPMVQSPLGSAHSPMVQSPMGQPPPV